MARKVTRTLPTQPDDGRDDVAIMYPDRTLTVAGREITLREYGFVDGLLLRARTASFVAALETVFRTGEGLIDDCLAVVGEHYDVMCDAIAQSAGVDVAWVKGLRGDDAEALQVTWWEVCGPFFLHQILRRRDERERREKLLAGRASSSSSPAPVSAPPSSSADTPPASSDSSTVS